MKKDSSKGLLFTFEGIDGCGKSVQAEKLAQRLKEDGKNAFLFREPGGTHLSEEIRSLLLDPENRSMKPLTELLLYEASRAQLAAETIEPSLDRKNIIICDRYTDSTLAYQGFGRGLPLSLIRALNEAAVGNSTPDRTYLLDVSWEESRNRLGRLTVKADRMEKEQEAFFERVRKGYLHLADEEPERIIVLDASGTIEDISRIIYQDAITYIGR